MFRTIATSTALAILAAVPLWANAAPAQTVTIEAGGLETRTLNPGDNLRRSGTTSDNIILFTEHRGFTLAEALSVNLLVEGADAGNSGILAASYKNADEYNGTIPTGTRLTSFLVHFDSPEGGQSHQVASFSFDQPVVGLIYNGRPLIESDTVIGLDGVQYSSDPTRRTAFGEPGDYIMVVPESNTVIVNSSVDANFIDQIRVLVAAP